MYQKLDTPVQPAATQVGSGHFAVYAKVWKFFGILERIYRHKPESFEEANKMIDDRIYFYNHERIQTKTGLAPLMLHQSC